MSGFLMANESDFRTIYTRKKKAAPCSRAALRNETCEVLSYGVLNFSLTNAARGPGGKL